MDTRDSKHIMSFDNQHLPEEEELVYGYKNSRRCCFIMKNSLFVQTPGIFQAFLNRI
jgi:hypothetical protein